VATDSDELVIAPENAKAWAAVERSQLGNRMKGALRMVASGEPIRAAAEAAKYSSSSEVWKYTRRFGLVDLRTKALVERHRRVSTLAGSEIEFRLLEKPASFSNQALGVLQGIGTDKALAVEKGAVHDGNAYLVSLEALALRLAETGKGVEVRVSVGPLPAGANNAAGEIIDVTPTDSIPGGLQSGG